MNATTTETDAPTIDSSAAPVQITSDIGTFEVTATSPWADRAAWVFICADAVVNRVRCEVIIRIGVPYGDGEKNVTVSTRRADNYRRHLSEAGQNAAICAALRAYGALSAADNLPAYR